MLHWLIWCFVNVTPEIYSLSQLNIIYTTRLWQHKGFTRQSGNQVAVSVSHKAVFIHDSYRISLPVKHFFHSSKYVVMFCLNRVSYVLYVTNLCAMIL